MAHLGYEDLHEQAGRGCRHTGLGMNGITAQPACKWTSDTSCDMGPQHCATAMLTQACCVCCRLDVCDGSRLMAQFLAKHEPPPPLAPLAPVAALDAAASADIGSGISSGTSKPLLPVDAHRKTSPATGGTPASGGLPDFLAAALSAAHGNSAAGTAAQTPTGRDGGGHSHSSGAMSQDGLPNLLEAVLAAARKGQHGAGTTNGSDSGGSMSGGNGMAGLLSAALAGGLKEVANGSQGSGKRSDSTGQGMPCLPARQVKRRPA